MSNSYREKYYGVYGTNGLGIFTNWGLCKKELSEWAGDHSNCKKFDNYDDANIFAAGKYREVMKKYKPYVKIKVPDELPINFFIITKVMKGLEELGSKK